MAEERILDTYRTTWNEFHAWETEYASGVIASLATDTPAQDPPGPEDLCFSQDIDIQRFRHFKRSVNGIPTSLPGTLPTVQAHPRYQACTPSNQNIMAKRPDYNPFVTPLFIPFADEPRFQSNYFLEEFLQDSEYTDPKLHWQSITDPDCEWVHLDVPRTSRLNGQRRGHTTPGISAASQTWIHCVSDRRRDGAASG